MPARIRTVHIGLGYMGAEIARLVHRRDDMEIAGAVDVDPDKVGRDVGEVIGLRQRLGVTVSPSIEAAASVAEADMAIQATGSYIPQIYEQLVCLIDSGFSVVSTCEELAFPAWGYPDEAEALDRLARDAGVTLLGTGVNPGFVMDRLPAVLSGVCQEVRAVRVTRVVDAALRRPPLQRKTGAGLTVAEFEARAQAKAIQHVGLPESVALIAAALGWKLEAIADHIEPVIAQERLTTDVLSVAPGQAAGLHQVARGLVRGREVITQDLWMTLGAENPRDEVQIDGIPPMHMIIPGGTHGDRATVATVVNAIPHVAAAPPGLKTVLDLPPCAGWGV